ncbi:MAG: HAD family hydrolase [Phycisphaerae bacterium]
MQRRFDGVIFDMDGTVIEPLLDFAAIRRELGIPLGEDILQAIEQMPPAQRQAAESSLLEKEMSAARQSRLMPSAPEVLERIRSAGLKTALLTRNCKEAMETVLQRFPRLVFDVTLSRECGPIKPEPDGIARACGQMGVQVQRTACVGDFRYDMVAARAAGATGVLLVTGERPDFADLADVVIDGLDKLPSVLGLQAGQ